jgi:hypothetical protein
VTKLRGDELEWRTRANSAHSEGVASVMHAIVADSDFFAGLAMHTAGVPASNAGEEWRVGQQCPDMTFD